MTTNACIRRGFTLIELLVSMAVGMIILIAAAALLGQTGTGYERVGGGVGAEREARALLTQLAADLSTFVPAMDLHVFEADDAGWRTDRIGFLSLQPADAQSQEGRIGDLCAVNYYIKDLQIAGRTVRCLMRGFRESAETFGRVRDGEVDFLFAAGERDEPVAFNVVSFIAQPVVRGATGGWEKWEYWGGGGMRPTGLDVRLVIARRDLAGKLRTSAQWDGQGVTGRLLGDPERAAENMGLEVFGAVIRMGNNAYF
jgi:prepilin-type N-terminal cleavage/methylation domain-containing protein